MSKLARVGVPSGIRGLTVVLVLFSIFFATISAKGITSIPVRLSWNPSPDTTVAGYRVYYNLASLPATNRQDVGPSQTAFFTNLTASSSYAFYVVAYNATGEESLPSNTLYYSPPALSKLSLAKQANGSMRIQLKSAIGTSCRIQYSSSLTSPIWQTLTTGTADANGNITVTDPLTGRPPMRFYRAMRL